MSRRFVFRHRNPVVPVERRLRTDDHEVDPVRLRKGDPRCVVTKHNLRRRCNLRNAGISIGTDQLLHRGRILKTPCKRMLTTAGTNEENVQGTWETGGLGMVTEECNRDAPAGDREKALGEWGMGKFYTTNPILSTSLYTHSQSVLFRVNPRLKTQSHPSCPPHCIYISNPCFSA